MSSTPNIEVVVVLAAVVPGQPQGVRVVELEVVVKEVVVVVLVLLVEVVVVMPLIEVVA